MVAVGVRELKARLSEYLRLVRAGELVLVTDRGQVVAEIRRAGGPMDRAAEAGLSELARRGNASVGQLNMADLYPPLEAVMAPGSARELLDEERSER